MADTEVLNFRPRYRRPQGSQLEPLNFRPRVLGEPVEVQPVPAHAPTVIPGIQAPAPSVAPLGFDEKYPGLAALTDILVHPRSPAQTLSEAAGRVSDIPQALTEPLEGFRGEVAQDEDRYAQTLKNLDAVVRRTGRVTSDMLAALFAYPSAALAPISPELQPVIAGTQNLLKSLPFTAEVKPGFRGKGLVEVITSPGALTTGNENLDAILDEVGGFLPFVVAGSAARTLRGPEQFRPLRPGEAGVLERERARPPATAEEVATMRAEPPLPAPQPTITPRPAHRPLTLRDLGVDLEKIRRQGAALRAEKTIREAPKKVGREFEEPATLEGPKRRQLTPMEELEQLARDIREERAEKAAKEAERAPFRVIDRRGAPKEAAPPKELPAPEGVSGPTVAIDAETGLAIVHRETVEAPTAEAKPKPRGVPFIRKRRTEQKRTEVDIAPTRPVEPSAAGEAIPQPTLKPERLPAAKPAQAAPILEGESAAARISTRAPEARLEAGEQVGGVEGSEATLKTASKDLPVRYRVVEADSLKTSHDAVTFAEKPDYPAGVQERTYHLSKEAQNRVIQQAQQFDPRFVLNTNPDAVNGPPIITPDGTVLGGNSRAMTINRLYSEGQGDRYKPRLFQEAANFGVDANAVNALRRPILVRELTQPVKTAEEARRIASDLNRSFTGVLGVNEKAVSAGRSITPNTLEEIGQILDDLGEGATLRDLLRDRPKPVIDALVRDGVISERERPQYVDPATGGLSEAGKTFFEKALMGSVVNDVRLLESVPRSTLNKVEGSLADLSRLRVRADEWDITPLMRAAIREHAEMSARGLDLETYLRQRPMFGPERNLAVDALVRTLAEKPKEVRAAIRRFTEDARADVQGQRTLGIFEKPDSVRAFNDAFNAKLSEGEYFTGLERALQEERHVTGREVPTRPPHSGTGAGERPPISGLPERTKPTAAPRTSEAGYPVSVKPSQKPPGDVSGGELSANAVFNPRFWERADAALRPFTHKIDQSLRNLLGRLPFSIRKWFQEDPRMKEIIQEARREVGQRRTETDAVLRMVLRSKPTPQELVIADRIARGVPENLSPAREPLRNSITEAAEQAHALAQQMTSERAALGLPVREEWLEGPRRWYPRLWARHVFSARAVAGRLFGIFRRGQAQLKPSVTEMGSLRPRTTDRWVVVDSTGKTVKTDSGQLAIFKTGERASAFADANSGFKLIFFDKGERGLKELTFPTIKERSAWVKEQGDEITVRQMLPGRHLRVIQPMTHEQAVAHGLIENLVLNLRYGFGKEWSLIAKTRALETIGRELASDTPQTGYVKLSSMGFEVPPRLAERNPYIARLRDGYVPESVAESLTAFYGRRGVWDTRFRLAEGALRKWVTVFSPFRHPRNIIENEIALAFGDPKAALNFPAMGEAFRDFARGSRGERNVPYYDEYTASGLASTDILTGEFATVWRGIDTVNPGVAPLSLTERMALWAETNPAAAQLLRTKSFVERLYRAEDQVWKYYFYRTLRERGIEPEAAAYRARRTFFDYEDVPPIIRSVNRYVPFIANISFQYSRILGAALRDRPATSAMKVALLLYGYGFMRDELLKKAGITEQDEKNMGKLGLKPWEFPLPMTDDKGRNLVINLQWAVPFSEVELLRYSAAEEEPERGLAQATRRFIPMVAQPAATAISQRGAFGQKILTGAETRKEARRKLAREIVLSALPGLLGQYWDRLYKNATAGPERKEPWSQKLAEGFLGNVQRTRPAERVELRKALLGGRARKVQEEAGRQRGRLFRGDITAETFRKEISKLRERTREGDVTHPETLAVVEALEGDRRDDARAAFQKLLDSGFYRNEDEAIDTVTDTLSRRERLRELEEDPLPEARAAASAVLEELRTRGKASEGTVNRFTQTLDMLSESDQDKLLEWVEQEMELQRKAKRRIPWVSGSDEAKPAPTSLGIPFLSRRSAAQ